MEHHTLMACNADTPRSVGRSQKKRQTAKELSKNNLRKQPFTEVMSASSLVKDKGYKGQCKGHAVDNRVKLASLATRLNVL